MKEIVIIGAGLGGLTAGALLAKDGYKVTILEQHAIVGGCATTFKRKGFTCEVGLHEMDGVYENPRIQKVFHKLDVYNHVDFLKVPEFFKITTQNGTFTMPDGIDNAMEALIKRFPKEEKGIKSYFRLLQEISTALESLQRMKWYHYLFFPFYFYTILKYKNRTVTEVFHQLFKDEALKLILNANVQYYNDTPDTLSFLLHSVAQYSYYKGGGYFIRGGSGRLSDYLASVIESHNGKVITKAKVLSCEKNRVTYGHKKESYTLYADKIVSNLSPADTYGLFDIAYKESKEVANSLLTVYIGFSKNIKEVYGEGAYSTFYYDDIESIEALHGMLKRDVTQRGFVFVDYSQIDSQLTKEPQKSFGVVCMTDYIEEWEGLSQEAYKEKKETLQKTVIQKLEAYYPHLSDHVEFIETGSAKTVQRYIKTPQGTAYGFKATPKQFFKVPQSKSKKVNTLYFVGQWVIAGGFSPSISSGYLCYSHIVSDVKHNR
jgi:all-trans-retinol 13,14-reductase